MLVSPQQKAFLLPSRVNSYAGAMVPCGGQCRNAYYEGVSAMPPVPSPTSSYSFCENTFREIEFFH